MQKYNTCPTEVEQLNLEIVVTGEDRQAQQEVLQASTWGFKDLPMHFTFSCCCLPRQGLGTAAMLCVGPFMNFWGGLFDGTLNSNCYLGPQKVAEEIDDRDWRSRTAVSNYREPREEREFRAPKERQA